MATGSVFFEIELLLSSDSGRPKHTDVVEQGAWLALAFDQALSSVPLEGVGFGRIRYWGDRCEPTGDPITEQDVRPYAEPLDKVSLRALRSVLREAAIALNDPAAPRGDAVREVCEWAAGLRSSREISDEALSFALRDDEG